MNEKAKAPNIYKIEVEGHLHEKWAAWLSDTIIRMDNLIINDGATVIVVSVSDQAGLRGLLNKLWDLNLSVLAVTRLAGHETTRSACAPASATPGSG